MPSRSVEKVRGLSANDLAIELPTPSLSSIAQENLEASGYRLEPEIRADNPVLKAVQLLRSQGFAGVILTGAPGTSKSWYAREVGGYLVDGDARRIRFVQFHPSYQYEDFVEGYVPDGEGSFVLAPKHFLEICDTATALPGKTCVLVIDEFSRCDPSRVFGETLTYIETSKRDIPFHLASGQEAKVPKELFLICTMNPWDKGVDEIDTAMSRRFAQVEMLPNEATLIAELDKSQTPNEVKESTLKLFRLLANHKNERCRLGHAYYMRIKNREDLNSLWENQLRFHLRKVLQFELDEFSALEKEVARILGGGEPPAPPVQQPEA